MGKEIKPGTGYGKIKFGASMDDIEARLGKPSEIERDEDQLTYWHYDDEILSLTFDGTEGWKLSSLLAGDLGMKLFDQDLDELSQEGLKALLKENGAKNVTSQDEIVDGATIDTIEAEDLEMIFWFENGDLTEVQWGPFFNDEDSIMWPE